LHFYCKSLNSVDFCSLICHAGTIAPS
jgi:hypothetical protein